MSLQEHLKVCAAENKVDLNIKPRKGNNKNATDTSSPKPSCSYQTRDDNNNVRPALRTLPVVVDPPNENWDDVCVH